MSAWLSRNAGPIGLVLLASAAVIGGFEAIDAVANGTPVATEAEATEFSIASLAGLIKVSLFLGIGALIARPIQRRFRPVSTA